MNAIIYGRASLQAIRTAGTAMHEAAMTVPAIRNRLKATMP